MRQSSALLPLIFLTGSVSCCILVQPTKTSRPKEELMFRHLEPDGWFCGGAAGPQKRHLNFSLTKNQRFMSEGDGPGDRGQGTRGLGTRDQGTGDQGPGTMDQEL